jgi:hypothetical protein
MTGFMTIPNSPEQEQGSTAHFQFTHYESADQSSRYSFAAEESLDEITARRDRSKLVSRIISIVAFGVWLSLMATLSGDAGDSLKIAFATLIPFVAHVANVCLTASRQAQDAGARPEP